MATVSYELFLPEVMPLVIGCPEIVALNAIRNSAVEFCDRSAVWNELQDSVAVTSADFPFDLEAPAGAKVSEILDVSFNSKSVRPLIPDQWDVLAPGWRAEVGSLVVHYYGINSNQIGTYPVLDDTLDTTMQMRVAYAPTRASTKIDDAIYQDWLEQIAAGALSRLLLMAGQQWANAQLATYYSGVFERGVADARVAAMKSFSNGSMAVLPRRFE